jgi:hypothetical protein
MCNVKINSDNDASANKTEMVEIDVSNGIYNANVGDNNISADENTDSNDSKGIRSETVNDINDASADKGADISHINEKNLIENENNNNAYIDNMDISTQNHGNSRITDSVESLMPLESKGLLSSDTTLINKDVDGDNDTVIYDNDISTQNHGNDANSVNIPLGSRNQSLLSDKSLIHTGNILPSNNCNNDIIVDSNNMNISTQNHGNNVDSVNIPLESTSLLLSSDTSNTDDLTRIEQIPDMQLSTTRIEDPDNSAQSIIDRKMNETVKCMKDKLMCGDIMCLDLLYLRHECGLNMQSNNDKENSDKNIHIEKNYHNVSTNISDIERTSENLFKFSTNNDLRVALAKVGKSFYKNDDRKINEISGLKVLYLYCIHIYYMSICIYIYTDIYMNT